MMGKKMPPIESDDVRGALLIAGIFIAVGVVAAFLEDGDLRVGAAAGLVLCALFFGVGYGLSRFSQH
jgi:hypothetical protein